VREVPSMKLRVILLAVLLTLIAAPVMADSWMPFQDKRVVSPTGKTYVVIRQDDTGITWELWRRAEGAAPMKNATAEDA
jgi:hypothetical protein